MEHKISSPRCSVVAWVVAAEEAHRRARVSNTPSRSPSRRFSRVRTPRLLSTGIESAQDVRAVVERTAPTQLVQVARVAV
jgi:hypothetical protein